MKVCKRCSELKDVSEFHKNKRKSDGLDIYCKSCNKERMKTKYHTDPAWKADKIKKTRVYHLENPEWSKERLREHHVKHRQERLDKQRERLNNPEVRKRAREASRRAESKRRAIKARSQVEHIKSSDLLSLLSQYSNKCWICSRQFDDVVVLHWDHFMPLSKGGPHCIDNLRPACSSCNILKNGRWPVTDDMLLEIKTRTLTCEWQGGGVSAYAH